MTPNMIKEIISKAALRAGQLEEHDYLPKTEIQAAQFVPHSWVVSAMYELANMSHKMESAIRQFALENNVDTSVLINALPASNPLKPVEVQRDENGYWSHPDWPMWDDGNTFIEIHNYALSRGFRLCLDKFENSCTVEQEESYYKQGNTNINSWHPTCNTPGAFLLSIHEADDGPIAVFAAPLERNLVKKSEAA
ncbi:MULTISPECIES: hypothetical protein [unclassified Pseudoalteromonas]|uniref:hypothetical protein n=1 Tax=unclassified Pseudoalteromonas TaxID=194690 RepID=UPI001F16350B|nr:MULTISPECIES: hypothetical protein [unclassified Pseudoalteromonas]MCF2827113.1 hypothetical protein [Pseudoalteromonas sp. OF5H-5]MCF2834256.1 hypothetical protein [Pseudoalteromonas sp. DL2-H6]MCF2925874.1 hypothetical protein [Pseudoalteromonas sp. DL2-H1]